MTHREEKHDCKHEHDVVIVHEKINKEQWSWVLWITHYASKFDVEEHEADEVGEIMSLHSTLISYCPYCGENLTLRQANTW